MTELTLPQIRSYKRMGECPFRRQIGCGDIDIALGWKGGHSLIMDECDACWAKGGYATRDGAMWRAQYITKMIASIEASIENARAPVIVSLLTRLSEPAKRPDLLRRSALRLGRDQAMPIAESLGIAKEIDAIFEAAPATQAAETLDPKLAWEQHEPNWAEIEKEVQAGAWQPQKASKWKQAKSMVAAMWSSRGGNRQVSPDTLNTRNISCFGVDLNGKRYKDPCPSMKTAPKGWRYCGHCGCGSSPIARLDPVKPELGWWLATIAAIGRIFGLRLAAFSKLEHPNLTCPRNMPGFTQLTINKDGRKSLKTGVSGSPSAA